MFGILKVKVNQGYQSIPDLKKAVVNVKYRGFPEIGENCSDCIECSNICPTNAISIKPLMIDLGKCIYCGDCERNCSKGCIKFSNFYKTACTTREHLFINSNINKNNYQTGAVATREEIIKIFGRSLKLRQVSAGGCNGCEMELNACSNVNFDMGRFGIDFVASPRHADGIVITGPLSENMAAALEDTYSGIPDSKIVIAVGSCAISGGIFENSPAINRSFFKTKSIVDLYVPGCPPHPLTFINGVLEFIGK